MVDNRRPPKRKHTSLTFFFASTSFLILLALVLLVGGSIVALVQTGVMNELTTEFMNPVLFVVLMAVACLVLGAGLSILVSRLMISPMSQILNVMDELSSGNFKARLHLHGRISKISSFMEFEEGFNKMAEELEHTEILRSDFVNNFSHEFKTPIVSIAGFARLLNRKNLTEEQKAEYTSIIEEESRRLSAMATNVLNLSKIESLTILTDLTEFNLSEQIRGCVLLLEEKWNAKNLTFSLDMDEESVLANEELLKEVWINLLDNAVKFAYEGTEIGVAVGEMGDTLLISVSDTGPVIPPEERDRIFARFYQTDRSHAASGNGIGLAVAKKIVDLHGGQISVSEKAGATVFTVMLPRGETATPKTYFQKSGTDADHL
ncbi:MAG: HAMP domain-containing histidine kinase [Clostridia bacterium]|nr:HAMP domain-containing histidine kinase [Clostridia bacterium]